MANNMIYNRQKGKRNENTDKNKKQSIVDNTEGDLEDARNKRNVYHRTTFDFGGDDFIGLNL